MELFADPVFLARLQFTITVIFHFVFVPLSIGLGLFMAIFQTKAYKSQDPKDEAIARFWVKVFALTFTVGVATGITMEFSFGTNWADYSRFVGDIFGSPLAAEALLAFFLESTFLGVLIFGKKKVGKKFYMVSSWLVWFGSLLSALWILIANSWMQTPAGYEIADGKAIVVDFFAAAFNPETIPTYVHTVVALVIMGAFVAFAFACYYHLRGRNERFVTNTVKFGTIVMVVATVLMMPAAHMQAKVVADEQPSKLAAMEGQYETEAVPMFLFGFVDTENQTVVGPSIPGLTSFLAAGDFNAEYPGLNDLEAAEPGSTPTDAEVQTTFINYHIMIIMMGVICLGVLIALILALKDRFAFCGKLANKRWIWKVMGYLWIAPFLAIVTGWCTAEFGRQPWIVYGELKTADAASAAVSPEMLLITIILFLVIYLLIWIAWGRLLFKFLQEGPESVESSMQLEAAAASTDADKKGGEWA